MKTRLLLATVSLIALPVAMLASPTPANARGCGGYVNILQWGCAPWDNNPPKAGVTPNYPAAPVSKPAPVAVAPPVATLPPAAPVVSNDGGSIISHDAGSIVSHDGGTALANDGATVVSDHGLGIVSEHGGGLVSHDGGGLVSHDGGGLVSHDGGGLVSHDGGSLIGHDGASLIGHDGASAPAGFHLQSLGSQYKDTGPTPDQLAAQSAMSDATKASDALKKASQAVANQTSLIKSDMLLLQAAQKDPKQADMLAQLQRKIATDSDPKLLESLNAAVVATGADFASKVTKVPAVDGATTPDAIKKLASDTTAAVTNNITAAKATSASIPAALAAAAAPAAPTQAQIDATNAVAKAQSSAGAAATAAGAAQDLVKKLGTNTPTNMTDIVALSKRDDTAAVQTFTANRDSAKAELAKMQASGANKDAIATQQAAVDKAQSDLDRVNKQVANQVNLKVSLSNNAVTDLQNAKAVVDGLTKAYGSTRPADQQQNATITAAMVVQALAQDKADQLNADAQAAKLIASGASKSDIQTQQDLSVAKQKDMAGILKVNPQVLAAAGVSGSTDPAIVAKAISGVVSTASKQTSAAVQQTTQAVQQANATLQKANSLISKDGPTLTPQQLAALTKSTDATGVISSLQKTSATLSSMSVNKPAAVATTAPNLPASAATSTTAATAPNSLNPAGGGAPVAVATVPAAAAAAPTATPASATVAAAPAVDTKGWTPAVVKQLTETGPTVLLQMQALQKAAHDKGDTVAEAAWAKDATSLQGQIDAARKFAAATPATVTTPATAAPASSAAATTAPPTLAATPAAATTTTAPTAVTSGPKSGEAAPPIKITTDQAKVMQQALRTIPVNLTLPEQKSFAALGTMVERAKTTGLTSEEATYLKEGIAALAEKHPKAEKQSGLTTIANTIATAKPAAPASPSGVVATSTPAASVERLGAISSGTLKPETPAVSVLAPHQSKVPSLATTPAEKPAVTAPVATSHQPAAHIDAAKPASAMSPAAVTHTDQAKPAAAPTQVVHTDPVKPAVMVAPKVTAAPVAAPKAPAVQVTAPKVTAPALAAAKPPAAPAAKPQTCMPNMQNGKQVGMICH